MSIMQNKVLHCLNEWVSNKQITSLNRAFALFLKQQNQHEHPLIILAGALVSYQLNQGDVYLDWRLLLQADKTFNSIDLSHIQSIISQHNWQLAIQHSKVISTGEGNTPLVWDERHQRLYLRRYWQYQQTVDTLIAKRLKPIRQTLPPTTIAQLHQLFPASEIEPDWQKIACVVALRAKFCIITGGPGTGKTTTLTKLLVLLVSLFSDENNENLKPNILLAAPTGKAANRVSESINHALNQLVDLIPEAVNTLIPKKASTIHRLLGSRPNTRLYQKNKNNPLIADIVIIDESSMIDLEMMAALLDALPESAQLILLGDKDQLSSVEPGYVFGQLCANAQNLAYHNATLTWIKHFAPTKQPINLQNAGSEINQQTVMLQHSYRFNDNSGIGHLANSINKTQLHPIQFDTIIDFFNHYADLNLISTELDLKNYVTGTQIFANYTSYLAAINHKPIHKTQFDRWAYDVLKRFDLFRVLSPIREGEWGVSGLNQKIEQWLFPRAQNLWYEGRPVIITQNDYTLGLMNGDIGMTLYDADQTLKVAFFDNNMQTVNGIRWFSTSRLSDVETAFALTVHKSQGSEFEHTLFVLPTPIMPILTKELMYTAITRAKKHFTLLHLGFT
jgi:exodeoxyribonuclease V alpha subunit